MSAAPGRPTSTEALASDLEEALTMLKDYRADGHENMVLEPLPSLLDQCEALCRDFSDPEPVRTLHHFACSGGTLIAKCVAALPNVVLLSEIDPLSRMQIARFGQKPKFAPNDVFMAFLQSARDVPEAIITKAFVAAIASVTTGMERQGMRLVLRDHAHSQFCTDVDPAGRPTLNEMLRENSDVLSLVSVRHPLDSFLSLEQNGWRHFQPFTLDEYSQRYTAFLDRHQGLPVVFYESFVADPHAELECICDLLALPFHPMATELIGAIRLTGDSGRSSPVIAPRPRRDVPENIARQRDGADYRALCARLGYDA